MYAFGECRDDGASFHFSESRFEPFFFPLLDWAFIGSRACLVSDRVVSSVFARVCEERVSDPSDHRADVLVHFIEVEAVGKVKICILSARSEHF